MCKICKDKSLYSKLLFSVLILFTLSAKIVAQPNISSFSPQSAVAGTTITIQGSNFNPVLDANIVFFGNIRAVVSTATSTTIEAIVPFGATNYPISVTDTVAHLTGFSSANFLPVFNGGATAFTTIAQSAVINTGSGTGTFFIKSADLDGDGKLDLIASYTFGTIGLFRNTSTPGNLDNTSFSSEVDIYSGYRCRIVAVTDMNGDGMPDLVTYNQDVFQLTVWLNQSVPGNISFLKAAILPDAGTTICVGDIDGDGRPDIIQMDIQQPSLLKVIKNNSTGGVLDASSFDAPAGFNGGNGVEFMAVQDLDGDGKAEIITSDRTDNTVSVFRNTAVAGTIDNGSLAAREIYPAGKGPLNISITDIDGDGKADIIVSDADSSTISILKNLSSTGTIIFAAPVTFQSGSSPNFIDVGDLDGDGKPDIAVCNAQPATLSVFKNTASPGIIDNNSLAAKSDFTFSPFPYGVTIGDLDGDGKPELAVSNQGLNSIAIFQTEINHSSPVITSFSPDSASTGQTVTIKGSHLSGTSKVLFGDSAAASFLATADTMITAVVGPGTSGKIYVTTSLGEDSAGIFTYIHEPILTPISSLLAGKGDTVILYGKYLAYTSAVSFGGVPALSFIALSDTSLQAVVSTGSSGNIQVTTSYGTTSTPGFIFVQPPNIFSFSPQTGGTGDTVYIHGRYLLTTVSVSLGGTPAASFQVISDTLVLVKIGSGSNGDILLDNIGDTVSATGFSYIGGVTVSSFSPAMGPLGTSVVITGTHFSNQPSGNIVYFGAVQANIVSASPTSLTVTVPAGTNMVPVSVTTKGSTAYARNPFIVTFSLQGSGFDVGSFSAEQVINTSTNPDGASVADLDADGKPDLVIGYNLGSVGVPAVSLLRNTGSVGSISFSLAGNFTAPPGNAVVQIAPTDLDGDGKLDLANSNGLDGVPVSIFRNTSVPGNIQLSDFQNLLGGGPGGFHIATGDLDGDGRPDIAVTSDYYPGATIFKNISSGSHIAYTFVGTYPAVGYSGSIIISDLNGDGKPDIAVATGNNLSVYRNTSSIGNISFGSAQTFVIQSGFLQQIDLKVADLDQDGKPDLVTSTSSSVNMVSVFQNNSSTGAISFAPRKDLTFTGTPGSLTLADFNGDGKPDLAVLNSGTSAISVIKNISSGGNIIMATQVDYPVAGASGVLSSGDLDGDGKPEIILVNGHPNTISIFRNLIVPAKLPKLTSFSPSSAKKGDTVNIIGTDLGGALSVQFGGIAASAIVSNADTLVQAIVSNGASGNVVFANAIGIDSLAGFNYIGLQLISFSPDSLSPGDLITIKGKHLTGATAVFLGNIPAAAFTVISDSIITATIGNGASGYVRVLSPLGTDSLSGFKFNAKLPQLISMNPAEADSGSIITIKGIYLTTTSAVSFGGVAASSFVVVSDTVLTAVLANGASGLLRITTYYGKDSLAGFIFDTTAAILPHIISFGPSSGSTDSVITIKGTHLGLVKDISFGGTAAKSFALLSDSVITAVVGAGSSGYVAIKTPLFKDSLPGFTYDTPVVIRPHILSFSPSSGSTDSVITIKGKHLALVTDISFGGTNAKSFALLSDSVITAVVGTGSSGYVTIKANLFSDSLPGFTYDTPVVLRPHILSFSPASGYTDSVITITGKLLTGITRVSFGGTDAKSFTVQSDSVITAVVGLGSSGYVAIISATDKDSLAGFTFTTPVTPPHINSFTPDSGKTGTTVLITGTGFTDASAVSFGTVPAGSFTVESDSVIQAIVGEGASGDVQVVTPNGTATDSGFYFIPGVLDSSFSLIQFIGADTTGLVQLGWLTRNDKSMTTYTVEHGKDTLVFTVLGSLPSHQQDGKQYYGFYDNNPLPGLNYYRLKMTDTSGSIFYSQVLTVGFLNNTVIIYPVPARNFITVISPDSYYESVIRVLDQSGKTLRQVQVPKHVLQTRVDLAGIIPGVYTVSWTDGYRWIARQIFIQF